MTPGGSNKLLSILAKTFRLLPFYFKLVNPTYRHLNAEKARDGFIKECSGLTQHSHNPIPKPFNLIYGISSIRSSTIHNLKFGSSSPFAQQVIRPQTSLVPRFP